VIGEAVAGESMSLFLWLGGMQLPSQQLQELMSFLLSLVVSHFQNYQQEPCESHVYEESQAYHRLRHHVSCKYGAREPSALHR